MKETILKLGTELIHSPWIWPLLAVFLFPWVLVAAAAYALWQMHLIEQAEDRLILEKIDANRKLEQTEDLKMLEAYVAETKSSNEVLQEISASLKRIADK